MSVKNQFDKISEDLDSSGGVMCVSMENLRDAFGVAKLGVHVVDSIKKELTKRGIGYYPETLSKYQHECVRLYRKGSDVDKLFTAMTHLRTYEFMEENEQNDEIIKNIINSNYEDMVSQVRAIVCP